MLLVHRAGQHDGWPALGLFAGKAGERGNHRGKAPFDVARAAAIEAVVLDLGGKRIDRHSVDGHRVLMGLEHQHAAPFFRRFLAINTDDDIVALGCNRVPFPGQSELLKEVLKEVGDTVLKIDIAGHAASHGIHAGNAHQIGQQRHDIKVHRQSFLKRPARGGTSRQVAWGKRHSSDCEQGAGHRTYKWLARELRMNSPEADQ